MNIVLWVAQALLAILYGMAGVMKTFQAMIQVKEKLGF